ncbi:MAG: phosphoenolpyruvate--protein phosphotransferase [Proteobacteria bacterium]|jgi:phosphotransferase system enzyme I (PtsI)|nr:phosphoenolpyruvate--protein phosphotransferase [Pseudomonadota bacterium]
MSIAINGIGLGGGIAIGNAYILDKNLSDATLHLVENEDIADEVLRFEESLRRTRRELELLRVNITLNAPAELGAFLSLSIMMLGDSQISQSPIKIIQTERCNVEWALKLQADRLALQFEEMQDDYLKERKHDIVQVLERIFKNLDGNKFEWEISGKLEHGILVTHDLSPADLVHFKSSNFSGFVTEVGSLTSHTAIVGRNLDIPSIVGTAYARQLIKEDELIIVDGVQGVLIINPDPIVLTEYRKKQQHWLDTKAKLRQIRKNEAVTLDGINIDLLANIESADEINDVKYNYANGVGLFRSEFLFLAHDDHLASEDEQFEAYAKVARSMKTSPVTIRTADFGIDKNPSWSYSHQNEAMNPALGLTGVRLSLAEHTFFKIQLRAILRASHYGDIQVMFPMVSSSLELKQAINHLSYAKEELADEGVPFNPDIKIGAMIEVPSSAIAIKPILALVDFISIGTNDLIQYLLAIDRNDETVNYLYNPLHPAVLKIIYHVIKSCNKANVPVAICGEMAGQAKLTRLLLGMGLRKFSMYSSNILNIKNVILNTNIESTMRVVNKILRSENIEKIDELVNELNIDLDF